MIYFDNNKQAYSFEIENPIATIDDATWSNYAGTDKWDIVNGVFTDISNTDAYKAKVKKQTIQTAKAIRDSAINEITNAKLLDDLQLDAGTITQAIYDARKTARLAQLAEVQTAFYTTTGLTQPTTITA